MQTGTKIGILVFQLFILKKGRKSVRDDTRYKGDDANLKMRHKAENFSAICAEIITTTKSVEMNTKGDNVEVERW